MTDCIYDKWPEDGMSELAEAIPMAQLLEAYFLK